MFALHTPILTIEMGTPLILFIYLFIYKNSAPQAGKSLDPSEGSTIKAPPLLFLLLLFCTHKTEWPPIWYNTSTRGVVVVVEVVVGGRGEGGEY